MPASVLYAKLLIGSGRLGTAARMLEKAWTAAPHPALIAAYKEARPGKAGIEWLTQLGKLVAGAPKHPESLLTLAEAALDARLWGEARRHLGHAVEDGATERCCRLMARLEESEHGDLDKARQWLMRAGEAARDPAWVCDSCGALAGEWQPRCGACGAYDSLAWHAPPRVPLETTGPEALAAEAEEAQVLEVAPVEVLTNGEDSGHVAAGRSARGRDGCGDGVGPAGRVRHRPPRRSPSPRSCVAPRRNPSAAAPAGAATAGAAPAGALIRPVQFGMGRIGTGRIGTGRTAQIGTGQIHDRPSSIDERPEVCGRVVDRRLVELGAVLALGQGRIGADAAVREAAAIGPRHRRSARWGRPPGA